MYPKKAPTLVMYYKYKISTMNIVSYKKNILKFFNNKSLKLIEKLKIILYNILQGNYV